MEKTLIKQIIDLLINKSKQCNCFSLITISDAAILLNIKKEQIQCIVDSYPLLFSKAASNSQSFTLSAFLAQSICNYYNQYKTTINLFLDPPKKICPYFNGEKISAQTIMTLFEVKKISPLMPLTKFEPIKDKIFKIFEEAYNAPYNINYSFISVPTNNYVTAYKEIQEQKNFSIAVLYAKGYTLEKIGVLNGYSKERSHVILKSVLANISRWLTDYTSDVASLSSDTGEIAFDYASKIFTPDGWLVICHVLQKSKISFSPLVYEPFLKTVYVCYDYSNRLNSLVSELQDETNACVLINKMSSRAHNFHINFIKESNCYQYILEHQLNFPSCGIKKGKISNKNASFAVIDYLYPEGISINDLPSLNSVVSKTNYYFGYQDEISTLITRIKANLHPLSQQIYACASAISFDTNDLNDISKFIENYNSKYVPINVIFNSFEEILQKHNVKSPMQLKSLLSSYLSSQGFDTSIKGYIINPQKIYKEQKYEDLALLLSSRPMNFEEIESVGHYSINDISLAKKYQPIVKWDEEKYYNAQAYPVSAKDKSKLKSLLESLFDNPYHYTNEQMLFSNLKEMYPDVLPGLSSSQLFFVCKYLFKDQYSFLKPHILSIPNVSHYSISTLINRIIEVVSDEDSFDMTLVYDTLYTICGENSYSTFYTALYKITLNYVRVSANIYYKKDCFSLSDIDKEKINDIINSEMTCGVLAVSTIRDFSKFPIISSKISWSPWMITDIIRIFKLPFKYKSDAMSSCTPHAVVFQRNLNFTRKIEAINYSKERG